MKKKLGKTQFSCQTNFQENQGTVEEFFNENLGDLSKLNNIVNWSGVKRLTRIQNAKNTHRNKKKCVSDLALNFQTRRTSTW